MKIPKYIQNKMHSAAAMYAHASETMKEIDDYLLSKGISPDVYRSGNGISLEEIEYGNDVTDAFVAWAAEDFDGESV